jgi:hypothetical protein
VKSEVTCKAQPGVVHYKAFIWVRVIKYSTEAKVISANLLKIDDITGRTHKYA